VQIIGHRMSDDDDCHIVDVHSLLNGEEVLNFAIDDYVADNFDHICVQAKDLAIYIINYEKQRVDFKVDGRNFSLCRQSIFFNPQKKQRHATTGERLKVFVEK
jgi:hypothetical protein